MLCAAVDRSEKVQCQIANRTRMRIDGDAFALVAAENVASFGRDTAQKLAITFAFRNYVKNVAVDQGVVVLWILLL